MMKELNGLTKNMRSFCRQQRFPDFRMYIWLPHFSHGLFRNWGRDTFIALPGCLLLTGRFEEARRIILAYGGCLRHGLIPNLIGEGRLARYNARDAVWWWLYAVCKYVESSADGKEIFKAPVRRLFSDDSSLLGSDVDQRLEQVVQEAMQRHFDGIEFRERNAGQQIDEHMQDKGFDIKAYIDRETGFVMGGNGFNCGTWMDKMGSSVKAGNRGWPATPRDGAAVELQGLLHFVLTRLDKFQRAGHYRHVGVYFEGKVAWSWRDWAGRMAANFERCFYVDEAGAWKAQWNRPYERTNIVADCHKASADYEDARLRPNFEIALAIAPELLPAEKAWRAILIADETLKGPIGMRSLDTKDLRYNGNYNNDDDSADFFTAKGFNYHNGAEWVWQTGYHVKAMLVTARRFEGAEKGQQAVAKAKSSLSNLYEHLLNSSWLSLPELTNRDGAFCPASCAAQAWSIATAMEALHELRRTLAEH